MPKEVLIALYIIGAGLEVAGILLVVAEMRADRRHALEVAGISISTVTHDPLENWPKSPSWSIQGAIDKDRKLQPRRAQAEVSRRLQDALVGILTGNQRLRVWGRSLARRRRDRLHDREHRRALIGADWRAPNRILAHGLGRDRCPRPYNGGSASSRFLV